LERVDVVVETVGDIVASVVLNVKAVTGSSVPGLNTEKGAADGRLD
jgi:hypothetical protein